MFTIYPSVHFNYKIKYSNIEEHGIIPKSTILRIFRVRPKEGKHQAQPW